MAGPILIEKAIMPRRITEIGKHSNPVYRSFIASFGVDLILRILNFYIMCPEFFYAFCFKVSIFSASLIIAKLALFRCGCR